MALREVNSTIDLLVYLSMIGMEMKSLKQRSVPRRVAGFLCACVVALALFLRTLVITWFLRPVRNWWSPSPFTAPVTPAEFFALLQSGDTERVKSVLRAGRDPNALVPDPSAAPSRGKNRKLPLSVAVGLANRDLVEVLVRHGANPFKCVFKQKTPLDLAMELDKVPLVESMLRLCIGTKSPRAVLRKKVKVTLRNALCQAVRKNNASLCRLMLQYGADPFADRCTSHWEVLVDCWRHRDHSRGAASDWGATEPNAFRAAVRQGNIAIVRSILQHSLDSEHTPTQSVHRTVHQSIIDIVDIVDKHPARTRQLLGVLREILRLWDALAVAMETTLQETERPALIHAVMVCSTNDPRRLGCVHALLTGGENRACAGHKATSRGVVFKLPIVLPQQDFGRQDFFANYSEQFYTAPRISGHLKRWRAVAVLGILCPDHDQNIYVGGCRV